MSAVKVEDLLPFEMGYLPDNYAQKARIEINESPENIVNGLRDLRKLIQNEPTMQHLEFRDAFLLEFLRARKFDVSRAFQLLKSFIYMKKHLPSAFNGINFESLSKAITSGYANFLPQRCPDGCAVAYFRIPKWDPTEIPPTDVHKVVSFFFLNALQEPMTQINGFKLLVDHGLLVRQLRHYTPRNIYLLYNFTQNCIPARYKEIHIVNQSVGFRFAYGLLAPLMPTKLRQRIHLHKDNKSLLKYFPACMLPAEFFGGKLENFKWMDWLKNSCTPENLKTFSGPQV